MPTKLKTKSIYWLTFARIVNGDIELKASALRDLLNRPVPPYSYKPLCQLFNKHLALNSLSPSFIDFFTLGPDKRRIAEDRRKQLQSMYVYLVQDDTIQIKEHQPGRHRFTCNQFHIPLMYDAVFRLGSTDSAFVKYLFAYSDPMYIANNDELDVLLALSTVEIPRQIKQETMFPSGLFPDFVSELDHEFWACRFSAFHTDIKPSFYTVKPSRVEDIYKRIHEVSEGLDDLLERISRSDEEIDRKRDESSSNL